MKRGNRVNRGNKGSSAPIPVRTSLSTDLIEFQAQSQKGDDQLKKSNAYHLQAKLPLSKKFSAETFFPTTTKCISGNNNSESEENKKTNINNYISDNSLIPSVVLQPNFSLISQCPNTPLRQSQGSVKPITLNNKMSLTCSKRMSLGGRCSGLQQNHGFPTKVPQIQPEATNLTNPQIDVLESKIQSMKKETQMLMMTKDSDNKLLAATIAKEDEIAFVEKENSILKDVSCINESIMRLMDEQAKLQSQHKQWIEDRKKKISDVRKETVTLQNPDKGLASPNALIMFPLNFAAS